MIADKVHSRSYKISRSLRTYTLFMEKNASYFDNISKVTDL
jgi:hypothetical protein